MSKWGEPKQEEDTCVSSCKILLFVVLAIWAFAFFLNWEDKGYRALYDWRQPEPTPIPIRYGDLTDAELCRIDPTACMERYYDTIEDRYP